MKDSGSLCPKCDTEQMVQDFIGVGNCHCCNPPRDTPNGLRELMDVFLLWKSIALRLSMTSLHSRIMQGIKITSDGQDTSLK